LFLAGEKISACWRDSKWFYVSGFRVISLSLMKGGLLFHQIALLASLPGPFLAFSCAPVNGNILLSVKEEK
jgi:hypothetical protein